MTSNEIKIYQGKDGRPMVLIAAGDFLFGPNREKVSLKAFAIDRYPVTNADYKKFIDASGQSAPPTWRRGKMPEGKVEHPVVQVTWSEANAYAEWAGKRLLTEQEWEKAARGTDGRLWPWGSTFNINKCNTSDSEIFDTTPVGKYSPEGDSPYGVADMAGNVEEWMGGKYSLVRMPMRGGNWLAAAQDAQTFSRRMYTPRKKNDFIGFRCAADDVPE